MVIGMVGAVCRFRKIKETGWPDFRGFSRFLWSNVQPEPRTETLLWAIHVFSNALPIMILRSDAR
jgi:hypothetical protein